MATLHHKQPDSHFIRLLLIFQRHCLSLGADM